VLAATLTKIQVKAFATGAVRIKGVKCAALDTQAVCDDGYTCLIVDMLPNFALDAERIRCELREYSEKFLSEIAPEAKQASLC
jgi:hypothetical protein